MTKDSALGSISSQVSFWGLRFRARFGTKKGVSVARNSCPGHSLSCTSVYGLIVTDAYVLDPTGNGKIMWGIADRCSRAAAGCYTRYHTRVKSSLRYRPPGGRIPRPDRRGERKDVEGCREGSGWKALSDCSSGTRELPPAALALGR